MRKKVLAGVVAFGVLAAVATAGLVLVDTPQNGPDNAPVVMGSNSTAQGSIDLGKNYLVQHNILAARDQFKLAVQTDSTNQEANLLYGVTRVFAVAEEGQGLVTSGLDSVREIFELTGLIFSKFSIYGSEYSAPEKLAATTPRTGEVLDFLKTKLLPEVDNALINLNAVSNTAFSSVIDPSSINKNSGSVITIDYADALVIRALLQAIKCNLELLMVYGLDVSLPDIQDAPDQLMTYKQLLAQDSTLLTPKDSLRLATAKTALISFIDTYSTAVPYLKNRPGTDHNLFVIDVPVGRNSGGSGSSGLTYSKLDEITNNLAGIKNSLSGQVYALPIKSENDRDRFIDLSKFFNSASPIDFRAQMANCATPKVLSDPTIGGLFPLGLSIAQDSNLPTTSGYLLGVTCTGKETPWLKVKPDQLALYDMPYYPSGPRTFSISNHGTSNLVVSSISLAGLNSSQFNISADSCGTVPPGGSCTGTASLNAPYPYSVLSADIRISSNDLSSPLTFVELWGMTSSITSNPGPSTTFGLTINRNGTGNGSVSFSGHNFTDYFSESCPSICSGSPHAGTKLEFQPVPSTGSIFSGWSGCDSVEGETCNVIMFSARNVTATFNRDAHTLSVMASPPGGAYNVPQTITLAASKDAAIYYTLDNSTPTAASIRYSGAISLDAPKTLKYIAIDPF
ncbi:MAG: chitobiase/beta-hexosaminidase C-terminal domain-containing protein, partial [Desulfuromonadales bacterium]|nr:chitobiase/beta-hexosaminidase C-terminal domain-containing protein [Desulfuromonadales bacterium]